MHVAIEDPGLEVRPAVERLDDALVREGLARELVRAVQEARKQANLNVSDRIELSIEGSAAVAEALAEHGEYIKSETLSVTSVATPSAELKHALYATEGALGEEHWKIGLARAAGK